MFATPSRAGQRRGPGRDSRRRAFECRPATWVALTAAALWAPSTHAFSMSPHALRITSCLPSRAAPGWGSLQTGRAQCCEVRQTVAIACRTRTRQPLTHCMFSCSTHARASTHTHTHAHAHTHTHACAHAHEPKRHTEQVKMAASPPRLGARGGPRRPPTADRAGADFIGNYYLHKKLLSTKELIHNSGPACWCGRASKQPTAARGHPLP